MNNIEDQIKQKQAEIDQAYNLIRQLNLQKYDMEQQLDFIKRAKSKETRIQIRQTLDQLDKEEQDNIDQLDKEEKDNNKEIPVIIDTIVSDPVEKRNQKQDELSEDVF